MQLTPREQERLLVLLAADVARRRRARALRLSRRLPAADEREPSGMRRAGGPVQESDHPRYVVPCRVSTYQPSPSGATATTVRAPLVAASLRSSDQTPSPSPTQAC